MTAIHQHCINVVEVELRGSDLATTGDRPQRLLQKADKSGRESCSSELPLEQ